MYKINFQQPIHIHFIGIGGISMSGLAEILLKEGFSITGSDMKRSEMTDRLEAKGALVQIGQKASNITEDIELVVYTAAIHPDNEELKAAQAKGIPTMTRAVLLGQIMDNYRDSIAVSGTHGKTTTTSMISEILIKASMDPTITVGGILESIGGNIRVGDSQVFVSEACEYTNSFLEFNPKIEIILNIEEDHLDFFSGIEEIKDSFRRFARKLPDNGLLIINGDMDCVSEITKDLTCTIKTIGLGSDNNYSADNITFDHLGNGHYDLIIEGTLSGHIDLGVAGYHNITNSLSAIAAALSLGVSMDSIHAGLSVFGGTKRRFEYKGNCHGFTIIDDYAHHPTEIEATLSSAKHYPHESIWCIFQPHTYTRTKAFLKEFAKTLSLSDHVILVDIYAAREKDTGEISSKDLLKELSQYDVDAVYMPTFEAAQKYLLENCKQNDLLITMGAGDVVNIGENLLK